MTLINMNEVNLAIAFIAGLVSFLSPCVLPLIPGFLVYLAGTSAAEQKQSRQAVFLNSLFFVLGFSLVFSALGVLLNTVLTNVAYEVQTWLSRLGGVIIITFGLYLAELIRLPWLEQGHKISVKSQFKSRYFTSFLFGLAFAAGWTPCVGAALGAILALAVTQPGAAFSLLLAYSLGLGLPFLVVGFFTESAAKFIRRFSRYLHYINLLFGVLLIILGILVFTQTLSLVANLGFVNYLIQRL